MNTHVGRHVVRVGGSENKLEFMLEKNQEIFIRFEVDPSFFGTFYPISVDRQTARNELKSKGYDIDRPDIAR
ncbi:hypothetical protein [Azospira restricta]|uniref:Uncharacterized protein n=1 Tax=Azospira restricta TaxID=404405 RepID=A0A974PWA9_9RHOO|nr:hypothetical protein [Azospira restricta]QRJ62268.1 hypothetical protein IWH25_10710 [Azospira restricta]